MWENSNASEWGAQTTVFTAQLQSYIFTDTALVSDGVLVAADSFILLSSGGTKVNQ